MLKYHDSKTQIIILGFVCFLCPGLFNALNGMGGGGQMDQTIANNANTALYVTFTIFGFLGGAFINILGIRLCIFLGGLSYALYSASYIYLNKSGNGAFTIAAGAIMGLGAGILWAGQGMIMMSYPREQEKGEFISIFWVIFNLGGVIGGIVLFASNYHSEGSLSTPTYIAFVVLECIGACLAWVLAPPSKVVRPDGSYVSGDQKTDAFAELRNLAKVFVYPMTIALIPLSFSSNFNYSYEFSVYNGELFSTRTRGFNNIWYWGAEMVASVLLSKITDNAKMSRKRRGALALFVVAIIQNIIWGCTVAVQIRYTATKPYPGGRIDFLESSRAGGPIAIYAFMGACDALWQNMAYWILGALTNDADVAARFSSFYKGMQCLGAVCAWQLAAQRVNFMAQLAINWALIDVSLPTMLYVIVRLKDTNAETDKSGENEMMKESVGSDSV